MLKIHESTSAEGALLPTYLRVDSGVLTILFDDEAVPLSEQALPAVMRRFGSPFDADANVTTVATLTLAERCTLRHVRHLARYDVISRDYLVYEAAGGETLCALATTVAGALVHLAKATRGTRGT
jgi:hypothetical protein